VFNPTSLDLIRWDNNLGDNTNDFTPQCANTTISNTAKKRLNVKAYIQVLMVQKWTKKEKKDAFSPGVYEGLL
jgi:hypothetical protein